MNSLFLDVICVFGESFDSWVVTHNILVLVGH